MMNSKIAMFFASINISGMALAYTPDFQQNNFQVLEDKGAMLALYKGVTQENYNQILSAAQRTVGLRTAGGWCSGVLVSPTQVVTALHCIEPNGNYFLEDPRLEYTIKEIYGTDPAERGKPKTIFFANGKHIDLKEDIEIKFVRINPNISVSEFYSLTAKTGNYAVSGEDLVLIKLPESYVDLSPIHPIKQKPTDLLNQVYVDNKSEKIIIGFGWGSHAPKVESEKLPFTSAFNFGLTKLSQNIFFLQQLKNAKIFENYNSEDQIVTINKESGFIVESNIGLRKPSQTNSLAICNSPQTTHFLQVEAGDSGGPIFICDNNKCDLLGITTGNSDPNRLKSVDQETFMKLCHQKDEKLLQAAGIGVNPLFMSLITEIN